MKALTLPSKSILKIQPPPHSIKLELTEGCNFYCNFCGIKSIREKSGNFKFLSVKTVKNLLRKIVECGIDNMKFDCAMHGEPLANKDHLEIFRLIRKNVPNAYIHVTTNGAFLLKGDVSENVDAILEYVNFINLDDYKRYGVSKKVLDSYSGEHEISIFPKVNVYARQLHLRKGIVVFPDISQIKTKRKLHNQAGNAFEKDYSKLKNRCHRPFREMAIKYDGSVILCCNDWTAKYKIGNINSELTLQELWNSKRYQSARKILFHMGRCFSICYGCNEFCYRVGLLPDRNAEYTMGLPNKKDFKIVGGLKNVRSKKYWDFYSKLSTGK